jgi:VWFA-related protein
MRAHALVLSMLLGGAAAAIAQTGSSPATPQPQKPVFRTGVDILTVDATVIDRDGRKITDMTPAEFTVEVDGRPRTVVSAEYVKLGDNAPVIVGAPRRVPAPPPQNPFFSTNARTLSPGRLIVLIVDEGNIRAGQGRDVMRGAVKFVDGLSPSDRVAVAAIPQGALVDFTDNHERAREALLATVGRASPFKGRFYMTLSEALATYEHSDAMLRAQLILRECAAVLSNPVEAARCEIEVEHEAGQFVNHQRQQTLASLRAMRDVLRSLASLDGPKSVILVSEGLVLEGFGADADEIAAIAADVRASLDVLLLDVPELDISISQRPTTPRQDRDKQVSGLEMLAASARGGLHRVFASSDAAFSRVLRSMAGYYLVAVEATAADRDGRRHGITVKSTRRGVTVLSRRGFLAPLSAAASSPSEAVSRALRAPLTLNDVPMRLATWTYKDPGTSKVRLLITAEIERRADQPLEYTAGFVLIDRNNRATASTVEPRTLREDEQNPGVAVFAGSVLLDPGTYLLRFAAVDNEGRLGSVERRLDAWQMSTVGLTVGDLLVGAATESRSIAPAIEPIVANGQLAAMMEIYGASLAPEQVQATIDVVAEENGRPLVTAPLAVAPGPSPEVGVVHGVVSTAPLPPGRYLARATVRQDGKTQGHLTRPFVVATAEAASAGALSAASLPTPVMAAMLAHLPPVSVKELLAPAVMARVLSVAETARPGAKAAFASARSGNLGPAALDALASGDQVAAAFLRGAEFLAQGQVDRGAQQLQIAMQQAPTFAPARLFLGLAFTQGNRHREAAALLQSVGPELAAVGPVARLAATSFLKAGDAANAVAALEQANATGDAAVSRTLALAYLGVNRPADAVPLFTTHLQANPSDADALLGALYATYASHTPSRNASALQADLARARAWAKSYSAQKGEHQALVEAWLRYLEGK